MKNTCFIHKKMKIYTLAFLIFLSQNIHESQKILLLFITKIRYNSSMNIYS